MRILTPEDEATTSDPMALTNGLYFAGMVGIIDPLRPEAKGRGDCARCRDRRPMITGDPRSLHERSADSASGQGRSRCRTGRMTDDGLKRNCRTSVFGRVTPEDKLRARVMQESGMVVAMTGDAVNAALKQADIGVAMGSGSEVTKQAGRISDRRRLRHAGARRRARRRVYSTVTAYVHTR